MGLKSSKALVKSLSLVNLKLHARTSLPSHSQSSWHQDVEKPLYLSHSRIFKLGKQQRSPFVNYFASPEMEHWSETVSIEQILFFHSQCLLSRDLTDPSHLHLQFYSNLSCLPFSNRASFLDDMIYVEKGDCYLSVFTETCLSIDIHELAESSIVAPLGPLTGSAKRFKQFFYHRLM